jgi:hypothetical protein
VADRIDGKATAEIQTEQRHRYVIEAPAQFIQAAAPSLGVEVTPVNLRDAPEIERALQTSRAPRTADRDRERVVECSSQADQDPRSSSNRISGTASSAASAVYPGSERISSNGCSTW